mgnify:CR=1 FL=1
MADGYPQLGFLNATVISNYASMNSIRTVVYAPESPVVVPPICDEIEQGASFGHLTRSLNPLPRH